MYPEIPPRPPLEIEDLIEMSDNATRVIEGLRKMMLAPFPRKEPPEFTSFQVAALCGLTRTDLKNKETLSKTIRGQVKDGSNQKIYSLVETIESFIQFGPFQKRPKGKKAKVIGICSYKGGVGKTTTAVCLAQGLALKGYKVLFLDLDGQGSATSLFGISPELEVEFSNTVACEINQKKPNFANLVIETYWHQLDLIPSSASVLFAEYHIPHRISEARQTGEFYNLYGNIIAGLEHTYIKYTPEQKSQLDQELSSLKDEYDVIVMDTSPSLNYLTQNAIFAADMIFAPCPQKSLDLASLSQFWSIFSEIAQTAKNPEGVKLSSPAIAARDFMAQKKYDVVEVFMSMTKSDTDELGSTIKGWLKQSYRENFWEIGIPESSVPQIQAAQLKTAFDMTGKETATQAFKRYKEPLDAFVDHVVHELTEAWRR